MLASFPANMLNQNKSDLGILNRFNLDPFRSSGNDVLYFSIHVAHQSLISTTPAISNAAPSRRDRLIGCGVNPNMPK
jgi:hypothetical protein